MHKAKIVSVTQPFITNPETNEKLTPEEFIAYCARVSNPANQMNSETAPKLIQYCIRNHHWSIFEMVNIVMEIETTRDIARQILRHRSFTFQEFSQRYADPVKHLGFVTREARIQDQKNRQNSTDNNDTLLSEQWEKLQNNLINAINDTYSWALQHNIAKEQARSILPEGLTVSKMYMNGTMRSWMHYCKLRMGNGTQKEHRLLATECWNQILQVFPTFSEAINNE